MTEGRGGENPSGIDPGGPRRTFPRIAANFGPGVNDPRFGRR